MLDLIDIVFRELLLFASLGLLIGGLDDVAIDLIWIAHDWWQRHVVFGIRPRATVATLAAPQAPGRIAILIPAWQEHAVIGAMLQRALGRIDHPAFRIYVGIYANDLATAAAVEAVARTDRRIRPVCGGVAGPTTKGECLNRIWQALVSDERVEGVPFKAIVIHDAEDIIHPAELRVFDTLIERVDMVQLPVLPLPDPRSRWIAGHYCDEFAEAHHRQLAARELLGASIPSAGVGCAISRAAMERLAIIGHGKPFDENCLTEDYEIGIRLAELGHGGIFVLLPTTPGGKLVAVRAHFPNRIGPSVRQKARWMIGIALAGWDRLGWRGHWAEIWMRLRDRRAPFAAVILVASYLSLLLWGISTAGHWITGSHRTPLPAWQAMLLTINGGLLTWRFAMRFLSVRHYYGTLEAFFSIPRMAVSNTIAMLAARRALFEYARLLRGGPLRWDKTEHHFPDVMPLE